MENNVSISNAEMKVMGKIWEKKEMVTVQDMVNVLNEGRFPEGCFAIIGGSNPVILIALLQNCSVPVLPHDRIG